MLLVVDVTKGMQTQTAECLVIGGVLCSRLVVVLNKTDLLPEAKRAAAVEKMSRKLRATLQNTSFRDAPVVALSARPGGAEGAEEATGGSRRSVSGWGFRRLHSVQFNVIFPLPFYSRSPLLN